MITRRGIMIGGAAALAWPGGPSLAEDWPSRLVKIVVPAAPGGSSDAAARIAANHFQAVFKQPFVIENRSGGGNAIGAAFVAQADPDGYTLGVSNTAAQLMVPIVSKNVSYDPVRDFTHILLMSAAPYALAAYPGLGVKTLADFIAKAKASPGKLTFTAANPGGLGHIGGEYFKRLAGIDINHVPYRGGGPATTDALAGHVDAIFLPLSTIGEHIRRGALVSLGVTAKRRVAAYPDIPTFVESGFPDLVYSGWFGISGPKGLPTDIVTRLNAEGRALLKTPIMQDLLTKEGSDLPDLDAAGYAAMIAADVARWTEVVRSMDLKLE